MVRSLGIAVIGAGDMGTSHTIGWSTLENARLVAVADLIEERARGLKEKYGFETWTRDYREAIDRGDVGVVSVCTPACYHPEVTVFAAERGKHVLCEKPIALTLEAADEMIEACKRNRVFLEIGFQRRYMESSMRLAELLQGGAIGRPVMFTDHSGAEIRPKRAMHDMREGNGGPIIDTCCHIFDLWRLIFDAEPIRVTARGFTFAKGRPELSHIRKLAPDTGALIVEHSSGDLGVMTITWGLPPGLNIRSYTDILGPKGVIFPGFNQILIRREGEEEKIDLVPMDAKAAQVHYFAKVVSGEAELKVKGENGRIALRVSLAALKSMEKGEPVKI